MMRIALLTRAAHLYSHRRLIESAEHRGHQIVPVNVYNCLVGIQGGQAELFCPPDNLSGFDVVIPRIGASTLSYGLTVLRQFEVDKVPVLNPSEAIKVAGDKLESMQVLTSQGVPVPVTAFARRENRARALVKAVGGAPVIVKTLNGSLGMGVILAETESTAVSIIQTFTQANLAVLVQQFIAESAGTDIRAMVIGDRVVAAMRRQGREGEFRSNVHRGGSVQSFELTNQEKDVAIQAARAVGLNVAGVDLLQSNNGPIVLEVNATPGFEGLEAASKADVAGAIIDFCEQLSTPHR